MQVLENKVIVYDDVCPMCNAYTAGFVRLGWLKHRTGFADAAPELLQKIDLDRARHEIPLLDTQTGEVTYGINALFLILGERMPFFKPLFQNRLFRAAIYQLYQLITYNRRIIAGSAAPKTGFDCAPDVNLFYRWLYIGLAATGATFLLWQNFSLDNLAIKVLLPLLGFSLAAVFFTKKILDFIGHWTTIALASALLISLLPQIMAFQIGIVALAAWMAWRRWQLLK